MFRIYLFSYLISLCPVLFHFKYRIVLSFFLYVYFVVHVFLCLLTFSFKYHFSGLGCFVRIKYESCLNFIQTLFVFHLALVQFIFVKNICIFVFKYYSFFFFRVTFIGHTLGAHLSKPTLASQPKNADRPNGRKGPAGLSSLFSRTVFFLQMCAQPVTTAKEHLLLAPDMAMPPSFSSILGGFLFLPTITSSPTVLFLMRRPAVARSCIAQSSSSPCITSPSSCTLGQHILQTPVIVALVDSSRTPSFPYGVHVSSNLSSLPHTHDHLLNCTNQSAPCIPTGLSLYQQQTCYFLLKGSRLTSLPMPKIITKSPCSYHCRSTPALVGALPHSRLLQLLSLHTPPVKGKYPKSSYKQP